MRVFVNNVDGFLAGAVCADLWKLSHTILGTRKGRSDALVPPFIKRIVMRTDVRKLLKAVASCDVIVYDLHDADLEELELVLRALHSSEITQDIIFILISSVGVWGRTQRTYESMTPSPEEAAEEAAAGEEAAADAGGEGGSPGPGDDAEAEGAAAASADAAPAGPPTRRPIPLKSEDYIRRVPAPKFQEWKSIETQVLALRDKGTVRPYVICAGIPYGNGEEAFLGLFKAAWQTRDTLRIIGDGTNFIPCVHARDCARLLRQIVETKPYLEYHLAVDRGDTTQKAIIQTVASEFEVGYEVQHVSLPEALLAELADILTLDLRLEPSPIMEPSPEEEPAADVNAEEGEAAGGGGGEDEAAADMPVVTKPSPGFHWWSEKGLVANIKTVVSEFVRWRRLTPVKLIILGPPGSGAHNIVSMLAEKYSIEAAGMDDIIENVRNTETPLGQTVRGELDAITAALNNPKSTGPYHLSTAVFTQILQEVILPKPAARFRGYVLSGFPTTAEEAGEYFLEDAPVPEVPADDDQPSRPPSDERPEKVFKHSVKPDALVVLSSSDESCQQRNQESERPMADTEFQQKMAKWKKEFPEEGPKLSDTFSERGIEPLTLDVDDANPADLCDQIMAHLEGLRPVYNFRVPQVKRGAGLNDQHAADAQPGQDEGAAQKEAEGKRKKKEEEDRLEAIKKEEFIRLEKHSEPLRQYLMSFVVPTLTTGLIDVCRATPEDPVAYLAEYLSTYSTQLAASRRRKRQGSISATPPSQ